MLFATGAGGDPERYRPLLEHLAAHDCQVIAPRFERFVAREATTAELLARPAGLVEALGRWASPDAEMVAVGHSIGGWAALCLAGATPWGRDGEPMDVPREPRVGRLALYAPAAGWFAAPGALDAVTAPMLVFAGELDTITPVQQVAHLSSAPAEVDLRVVPKAGHFSFMDAPPPGTVDDPAFDGDRFRRDLAEATLEFATAP
ncbi:alpha/beta hydrolase family protein [Streptacidiphilus rugosus]|uniref:alpha/beta hydrolase family protein n=1 Tax=Streptacidiphilus rugosus TaxID=405783 RepID=UPI00068C6A84|nr:alpha/beta hydrolase [Streptacidiphilus rugosus]